MPRLKKAELSAQGGAVKRGNPDFVSSSFYCPKKVNIQFDRAILTLKANGFEVDRSDVLSVLMDRFASAVDAAEQQGDEVDFESVLAAASEKVLEESAEVSGLRNQLMKSLDSTMKLIEESQQNYEKASQSNQEIISILVRMIPEEQRGKVEELLASREE